MTWHFVSLKGHVEPTLCLCARAGVIVSTTLCPIILNLITSGDVCVLSAFATDTPPLTNCETVSDMLINTEHHAVFLHLEGFCLYF